MAERAGEKDRETFQEMRQLDLSIPSKFRLINI